MIEAWRPVVGYEGFYEVSSVGRVRGVVRTLPDGRTWKGRLISMNTSPSGHKNVRLCKSEHSWHWVHRMVLQAFVGPCPTGMECAHNNGDPSDNRVANLRWDTRAGNHADKNKHGTAITGSRNHSAKLSADDVLQIRRMRKSGSLLSEIAEKFNITAANASSISTRKTWKHLEA